MNHLRYRLETLPAALNAWKMPSANPIINHGAQRGRWIRLAGLLVLAAVVAEMPDHPRSRCRSPRRRTRSKRPSFPSSRTPGSITAKLKLEQNRPDEALALLVSALKGDPASREARELAETILSETVWNLPELTIDHPLPVDQIACAAPSSLWVSLAEKATRPFAGISETLQIESVLFPTARRRDPQSGFRPDRQRGGRRARAVTLALQRQTLKPIRDLGPLPDDVTPSAVIVFSPDGLLMAHPDSSPEDDHSIVWHIRDSATGEIIRTIRAVRRRCSQPARRILDRGKTARPPCRRQPAGNPGFSRRSGQHRRRCRNR